MRAQSESIRVHGQILEQRALRGRTVQEFIARVLGVEPNVENEELGASIEVVHMSCCEETVHLHSRARIDSSWSRAKVKAVRDQRLHPPSPPCLQAGGLPAGVYSSRNLSAAHRESISHPSPPDHPADLELAEGRGHAMKIGELFRRRCPRRG